MVLAQLVADFSTLVGILVGVVELALAILFLLRRLRRRSSSPLRPFSLVLLVLLVFFLVFIPKDLGFAIQVVVLGASSLVAGASYGGAGVWGRDTPRRVAETFPFCGLRRALA